MVQIEGEDTTKLKLDKAVFEGLGSALLQNEEEEQINHEDEDEDENEN